MIYPNRELEELYVENQSVWEEVFEGDRDAESALHYMHVEPETPLWDAALESLLSGEPPL